MNKSEMLELSKLIAASVVEALESKGIIGKEPARQELSAYQKTERLLYNYTKFKEIIKLKEQEIETIRRCGVPKQSTSILEYASKTGAVHGLSLEEESVQCAIRSVQASVQGTVQAISLIDSCMESMKLDPYYCILEMRYFEGRTQEDIADHLNCSQVTVSKNKNRLVKELSIKLFPNQAMEELMN